MAKTKSRKGTPGKQFEAEPKPKRKPVKKPVLATVRELSLEQDMVVLQMSPDLGLDVAEGFVLTVFDTQSSSKKRGAEWICFVSEDEPHVEGLNLWIGLSQTVPLETISLLQKMLETQGGVVKREMGNTANRSFRPFACLADDGLEILVPEHQDVDEGLMEIWGDAAVAREWRPISKGRR